MHEWLCDVSAGAKRKMPDFMCKKEQVANQDDGSLSWGKVEALLINLLLLP